MPKLSLSNCRPCWIGGARYPLPLDQTTRRKWEALSALGIPMRVVGFTPGVRPRHTTHHAATFYLLPAWSPAPLRYGLMFTLAPLLLLWLILVRGVNVLIAQSPYEGAIAAFAKSLARLLGRRVALVIESHGDFEVSIFMQRRIGVAWLYRGLMPTFTAYALSRADAFRMINRSTTEQLETWQARLKLPPKPVETFMAWTDSEVFFNTPRAVPITQAHDLAYVGVRIPRKGIHHLIAAFVQIAPQHPATTLWLIGTPDDPEYAAALEGQIAAAGLGARIRVVNGLPQAELAARLGTMRALILPSLSEGLPRVIIEAMMTATPAIGSAVSGIPEMIREGENGYLVPPGDEPALAAALTCILTLDEAALTAMSTNARHFAEQFFSVETYVNGYRRLLERVCG